MPDLSRNASRWIFVAVLLVAAGLRLATVHFGLPALNDPDELIFELGAVKLLRNHTLNPGWFGHPATTTLYALAILDASVYLAGWLAGWFTSPAAFAKVIYFDPSWVILPGRIMIVLFSLAVILLTYRLARLLFDRRTSLIAAAFLAFAPVHVTWSQIIRADMMGCTFMLLTMISALRVVHQGRTRDTLLAAMWLALAVASKWPFVVSATAMIGAASLRWPKHPEARAGEIKRLLLFGCASLAILLAVSPYLLLSFSKVVSDVAGEAQSYHLGATGGSPGSNAVWYLTHPLLASFGLGGIIAAAAGVVLMLRNREARAILMTVGFAFSIVLVAQHIVWNRWVLPLLPILAIAAGHATITIFDRIGARLSSHWRTAVAVLLGIVLFAPLFNSDIGNARARMNDTRQLATRWLLTRAPPGSRVMIEQFSFDLVGKGYTLLFPVGDAGCLDAEKGLNGKISFSTVEELHSGRTNIDYGTLSPMKVGSCDADFAILSQYDRYAAERARFPRETAQYESLLARGLTLIIFRPEKDRIGGPVVRIVALGSAPSLRAALPRAQTDE